MNASANKNFELGFIEVAVCLYFQILPTKVEAGTAGHQLLDKSVQENQLTPPSAASRVVPGPTVESHFIKPVYPNQNLTIMEMVLLAWPLRRSGNQTPLALPGVPQAASTDGRSAATLPEDAIPELAPLVQT